jgi:catechol 2,3-dioxygenase
MSFSRASDSRPRVIAAVGRDRWDPVITAIGHVALQVADLGAAESHATGVLDLAVREHRDNSVFLACGAAHHALQYIASDRDALDHIGLEVRDATRLSELRQRIDREGLRWVSEAPLDDVVEAGVAFEGPEGFVFECYVGMSTGAELPGAEGGVRPLRFGHVNLSSREPAALCEFFERVLDFRVSDAVGDIYFLRCNSEHHGIAIGPGEPSIHHHAWEVAGTEELATLCDTVDRRGEPLLWGPVRHGCGRNIAVYVREPAGVVVEYYCDMEHIDERTFVLPQWNIEDHKWYSLWAPMRPIEFRAFGLAPAERTATG